jgi:hypothetical protein
VVEFELGVVAVVCVCVGGGGWQFASDINGRNSLMLSYWQVFFQDSTARNRSRSVVQKTTAVQHGAVGESQSGVVAVMWGAGNAQATSTDAIHSC